MRISDWSSDVCSSDRSSPVIAPFDILRAVQRVSGRVRVTPTLTLGPGTFGLDARLSIKLECMQHTGSFKPRGAFNRMLSQPLPEAGVIAASGGKIGSASCRERVCR